MDARLMTALYVDTDPFACEWTENLIAAGHVAPGVVWNRDVWDIVPDELEPFTQVHLFAGIAVWSYALRSAGWPDDRPVWTASCPCQPFSAAGARRGFADERDAWPAVLHLLRARRPVTLFGEQVGSAGEWWTRLLADLSDSEYVAGGVDSCASIHGHPRRRRIYFAAHTDGEGERPGPVDAEVARVPAPEGLPEDAPLDAALVGAESAGPPSRMGALRAYGNALCAEQARAFIEAYMEIAR